MITREWLDEYRHVPRVIKQGFLSKPKVVFVLQQKCRDHGTYYFPDPSGRSGLPVDNTHWVDCEVIPEGGGIKCGKK